MLNNKFLDTLYIEEQEKSDDPLWNFLSGREAYFVKIYLDLENNRVFISNLNQKIFIIDISNLIDIKLLNNIVNPNWGYFVELSTKDKLFIRSRSEMIDDFKVYSISNLANIEEIYDQQIKPIHTIVGDKVYALSKDNCTENNEFEVYLYSIQNISNNESFSQKYNIPANCYSSKFYFDDHYIYKYEHYGSLLTVYQLTDNNSTLNEFNYDGLVEYPEILSHENHKLFIYSNSDKIVTLDTEDITHLKIKDEIPYLYGESDLNEFIYERNLNLYIQEDYIVSNAKIINLKAHLLSSIYTETEEGIDLTLFEPF